MKNEKWQMVNGKSWFVALPDFCPCGLLPTVSLPWTVSSHFGRRSMVSMETGK
jgi:hypothetical protein